MAKDPFDLLDEETKDRITGMNEAGIREYISKVALDEHALRYAMQEDQALKEAKQAYAAAGASYKEAFKTNRQKIKFASQVLSDQGKYAGEASVASQEN
jgi:outer membrane translocation and assembly module TamA